MEEEVISRGLVDSLNKHSSVAFMAIILVVGGWLIINQVDEGKQLAMIQTQISQISQSNAVQYTQADAARDKQVVDQHFADVDRRLDRLEEPAKR